MVEEFYFPLLKPIKFVGLLVGQVSKGNHCGANVVNKMIIFSFSKYNTGLNEFKNDSFSSNWFRINQQSNTIIYTEKYIARWMMMRIK